MPKPLAISDDSEYNAFYFEPEADSHIDDLTTESFFHDSTTEYIAATYERISELKDLLAFSGWNYHEKISLELDLKEAEKLYSELTLLNVG